MNNNLHKFHEILLDIIIEHQKYVMESNDPPAICCFYTLKKLKDTLPVFLSICQGMPHKCDWCPEGDAESHVLMNIHGRYSDYCCCNDILNRIVHGRKDKNE